MRFISVPADFRTSTVDGYADLNSRYDGAAVAETYGQATIGVFSNSGRVSSLIPPVDLAALQKYIAHSRNRGIEFNYTFNASCLGNREFRSKGLKQINHLLDRLWDVGVRHLTVTLPQMMTIVQQSGYPFKLKASTICQIDSAHKAGFYRDMGVERLVIDEDITRDFGRIRQICATFGDGVEMIANSACLKDCPYKMFHYNDMSHASFTQDIKTFHMRNCAVQKTEDPLRAMHLNWVRPEDLHLYEAAGVHWFKLQGRQSVLRGDPVKAAEAYMRGSYDGNLYDLLRLFDSKQSEASDPYPYLDNRKLDGFLDRFASEPGFCDGDCSSCRHCDSFGAEAMDLEAVGRDYRAIQLELAQREPFAGLRQQAASRRVVRALGRRAYSAARTVSLRVNR